MIDLDGGDAGWITAIATVLAAFAAIVALLMQGKWTQRALGADVYYKLEEKFFHTELMRGLRRKAARELLEYEEQGSEKKYEAFDDLADFFDFVGVLVRRRILDREMAWSSFYRRAYAFWSKAEDLGIVEDAWNNAPQRWNEYKFMVEELAKLHAKFYGKDDGKLTKEQREWLLKQESKLPVILSETAARTGLSPPTRAFNRCGNDRRQHHRGI